MTRFIYLSGMLANTVTDSQVINWLQLYQESGIKFDLILIPSGLKSYWRNRKLNKKKKLEAQKIIKGRIYQVITIKSLSFIGNVGILIMLLGILYKEIIFHQSIVIQTRSYSYYYSLLILKKLNKNVIIIYDSRGAVLEEYLLSSKMDGTYNKKLFQKMNTMFHKFENLSTKIFSVSNKLKEYHLVNNVALNADKIDIIPCCADKNIYYFDFQLRNKRRKELNLDNKIVLIYSGALNNSWQGADILFSFVSKILDMNESFFFMVLTPDDDAFKNLVERYDIDRKRVVQRFVHFREINDYLNAADWGILLRADTPTNNVASPTKFAEYIMSGLPVIISESIGDFSSFVGTKRLGLVLNNRRLSLNYITEIMLKEKYDRNLISEIGTEYYSKQSLLPQLKKRYMDYLVMTESIKKK